MVVLFRPTGIVELGLIYDSGMKAFPPRLQDQPIFYPVTNARYAASIARDWNTKTRALAGYVTRFSIDPDYAAKFDRHIVGGREHEELWVPAGQLREFNDHITGPIAVVASFFGDGFEGMIPDTFILKGRTATEQLVALDRLLDDSPMDFSMEVRANHRAVFLNYPFWNAASLADRGISEERRAAVLVAIQSAWAASRPPLPSLDEQGAREA